MQGVRSTEELVEAIRAGRTDLMHPLWISVERFVRQQAHAAMLYIPPNRGCTEEDLRQSGYIALCAAVESFDREKGAFLTWLGQYLRREFMKAAGYSRRNPNPLDSAASLDAPVSRENPGESSGEIPLIETVCAEREDGGGPYADVEERIYTEQLHAALDRAIQELPTEQAAVIRGKYWDGVRSGDLAAATGVSASHVRYREREGLRHLRQHSQANGLAQFLAENTDYSGHSGLSQFRRSGMSAVERAVLRREELAHRWLKENK